MSVMSCWLVNEILHEQPEDWMMAMPVAKLPPQWQKVRVSWDTASNKVPQCSRVSGTVRRGAAGSSFGLRVTRLNTWWSGGPMLTPKTLMDYPDYFSRTEDGGYRAQSTDYPSEDYDVAATTIAMVGPAAAGQATGSA